VLITVNIGLIPTDDFVD